MDKAKVLDTGIQLRLLLIILLCKMLGLPLDILLSIVFMKFVRDPDSAPLKSGADVWS